MLAWALWYWFKSDASERITSTVHVVKDDGTLRICGDYKLTVNQVSQLDNYPIPMINTLFAEVSGCQKYV